MPRESSLAGLGFLCSRQDAAGSLGRLGVQVLRARWGGLPKAGWAGANEARLPCATHGLPPQLIPSCSPGSSGFFPGMWLWVLISIYGNVKGSG